MAEQPDMGKRKNGIGNVIISVLASSGLSTLGGLSRLSQ